MTPLDSPSPGAVLLLPLAKISERGCLAGDEEIDAIIEKV